MTSQRSQGIGHIWPAGSPLIGMVHLPPLPGSPRWRGSMDRVVDRARADAETLATAGYDALLVENFFDAPFFGATVPPETVAAMTVAVDAAGAASDLPVGVNVLRNDARAALAIAAATGAAFVRVNVHTGVMWTDQGVLEGRAAETLRVRAALGDVGLLADVHVKHATAPPGHALGDAAADAWHRGLADALVVSGSRTGAATPLSDVGKARAGAPAAAVLVGSGVTAATVAAALDIADGVIVGSSLKSGGRADAPVDLRRARALVEAAGR